MKISNIYKDGFVSMNYINETSTWNNQIMYYIEEHFNGYRTKIIKYTINYNADKQYFYCTYCLDGFWKKTQKYFFTEKAKNKLYLKLNNILIDNIRHEFSYIKIKNDALKKFPHFMMEDTIKCFGI